MPLAAQQMTGEINRRRLLAALDQLGRIGRLAESAGGGIHRRPFSPAERAARQFFAHHAGQAGAAGAGGLHLATDGAGNLSARLPAASPAAPTLLLGSHLDTVPNGGSLDGALGVVAALEVLLVAAEQRWRLPFALEAIAFTDEEGHFEDFFGSRAVAGAHTPASMASFLTGLAAHPADRALPPAATLSAESVRLARRDPAGLVGYLELHIEQGPSLDAAGIPIGVVTAIAGRTSFLLVCRGRRGHAGTTPMTERADALVAASRFITAATELAHRHPGAVLTCGILELSSPACNVVPGLVRLHGELRSADAGQLDRLWAGLLALVDALGQGWQGSCRLVGTSHQPPVPMDPGLQDHFRQAAEGLGYRSMPLSSGAGHDAQVLAAITRAGLLFVPSRGGLSHCPAEETAASDLLAGAEVLLATVLRLAAAD